MFEQSDKLVNKFLTDADKFVRKLKTKRIPVQIIKSEYPFGTTDGEHYTIIPRQ